ncbi:MAG: hypothetical protein AAFP69_23060, partial [Planctomycetota bacterium]
AKISRLPSFLQIMQHSIQSRWMALLFHEDYAPFERGIVEAFNRDSLPIYSYCVMPNHWYFVVRPTTKLQVTRFFVGLPTRTPCVGTLITGHKARVIYTRGGSRRSQSKPKSAFSLSCGTLNATRCEPICVNVRRIGNGAACGVGETNAKQWPIFLRIGPSTVLASGWLM